MKTTYHYTINHPDQNKWNSLQCVALEHFKSKTY
jgi:hypothetical protein